jgi:hypothetical protein
MNALLQHLKNPSKTLKLVPSVTDLMMDDATSLLVDRVFTVYRLRNDPNMKANGWFFATGRRIVAELLARQKSDSVVLLQLQPGIRVLHLPSLIGDKNPLLPDMEFMISTDHQFEPMGRHGFRVHPFVKAIVAPPNPIIREIAIDEMIQCIDSWRNKTRRRRRRFRTQKNRV